MDINQTPVDPSQFGSNVPRRHDPKIAKLAAKYLEPVFINKNNIFH